MNIITDLIQFIYLSSAAYVSVPTGVVQQLTSPNYYELSHIYDGNSYLSCINQENHLSVETLNKDSFAERQGYPNTMDALYVANQTTFSFGMVIPNIDYVRDVWGNGSDVIVDFVLMDIPYYDYANDKYYDTGYYSTVGVTSYGYPTSTYQSNKRNGLFQIRYSSVNYGSYILTTSYSHLSFNTDYSKYSLSITSIEISDDNYYGYSVSPNLSNYYLTQNIPTAYNSFILGDAYSDLYLTFTFTLRTDTYINGYEDGYNDGSTTGYDDGYEQGKADGIVIGRQEGNTALQISTLVGAVVDTPFYYLQKLFSYELFGVNILTFSY